MMDSATQHNRTHRRPTGWRAAIALDCHTLTLHGSFGRITHQEPTLVRA